MARRADELDRVHLLAQLMAGTESDDINPHPHRDDLDEQLGAPIGREADALARLEAYLKG